MGDKVLTQVYQNAGSSGAEATYEGHVGMVHFELEAILSLDSIRGSYTTTQLYFLSPCCRVRWLHRSERKGPPSQVEAYARSCPKCKQALREELHRSDSFFLDLRAVTAKEELGEAEFLELWLEWASAVDMEPLEAVVEASGLYENLIAEATAIDKELKRAWESFTGKSKP